MWKNLIRCLCVGARGQRRGAGWFSLINAHSSRIRSVKFAFAFISSLFFTSPADSYSAASCWETLSVCLSAVKARCHSGAHLPLAPIYFSAVPRAFLAKAGYWKPTQNRWNRCERRTFVRHAALYNRRAAWRELVIQAAPIHRYTAFIVTVLPLLCCTTLVFLYPQL